MLTLFILAYDSMIVTAHVTSEHLKKKKKNFFLNKNKLKAICCFAQIMGEQDQKKRRNNNKAINVHHQWPPLYQLKESAIVRLCPSDQDKILFLFCFVHAFNSLSHFYYWFSCF